MESVDTDGEVIRRSVAEPAVLGVIDERHGVAVLRYVLRRVGGYDGEDLAGRRIREFVRTRARYQPDGASLCRGRYATTGFTQAAPALVSGRAS